jgi:hypothetical protein
VTLAPTFFINLEKKMPKSNVVKLEPKTEETERVYVRRVAIHRKDCIGNRYYMVFTLSGSFSRYLKATDRDSAKKFVQNHYPKVSFWR